MSMLGRICFCFWRNFRKNTCSQYARNRRKNIRGNFWKNLWRSPWRIAGRISGGLSRAIPGKNPEILGGSLMNSFKQFFEGIHSGETPERGSSRNLKTNSWKNRKELCKTGIYRDTRRNSWSIFSRHDLQISRISFCQIFIAGILPGNHFVIAPEMCSWNSSGIL